MKWLKSNISLLIISIIAGVLRFVNLGYSNYQGDEIKALYLPTQNQSFAQFILDQRKGPVQFVITYILKFFDPIYDNEFLVRFVFALAGTLAVVFFYKLITYHFGKKIAFYASFFLATNGFFIAFSRIVQYQSFVILFMILALYCFTLAVRDERHKISGLYLGFIAWAISILSHYDGILIAPFVIYLLIKWVKNNKDCLLHLFMSALVSGLILLSFYVPFILALSESTLDYWTGRITGDVSAKISSSKYLFTVYQPIYVVHIYLILSVLGGGLLVYKFIKERDYSYVALLCWLLLPLILLEGIVYIPGTHIYNYLLPLFVFLAYGIKLIERVLKKYLPLKLFKPILVLGVSIVFVFISAQSYAVYVENSKEYPWENEKFLLWTLPKPTPIYHLSMFGFPYYRNWEGIRDFARTQPQITAYSTNERKSIVRYFVPLRKSSDEAGMYIYIEDPQSFTNEVLNEKPAYWVSNYEPVFTLSRKNETQVRVYVMPVGTLKEIIEQGY